MSSGRIILIAGVPRSGSTWLYNVARMLLERVGPVHGYWIDDYREAGSPPTPDDGTLLIKLHEFEQPLADAADVVLTSRRDLVEIAASADRLGWAKTDDELTAFIDGVVWKHEAWRAVSAYELAFERLARDAESEVLAIAEIIGVQITPADAEAIARQVASQRFDGDKGTYDPRTLLHPRHIARAPHALHNSQAALIRDRFARWQRTYGYQT